MTVSLSEKTVVGQVLGGWFCRLSVADRPAPTRRSTMPYEAAVPSLTNRSKEGTDLTMVGRSHRREAKSPADVMCRGRPEQSIGTASLPAPRRCQGAPSRQDMHLACGPGRRRGRSADWSGPGGGRHPIPKEISRQSGRLRQAQRTLRAWDCGRWGCDRRCSCSGLAMPGQRFAAKRSRGDLGRCCRGVRKPEAEGPLQAGRRR